MAAPSRMSKEQLFEALSKLGYHKDEIAILKRPDMIKILKNNQNIGDIQEIEENIGKQALEALENAEEESTENIHNNEDDIPQMTPQDPGWTQHILGKFTDDEIDGKNPRVEGLRRVAEEVIGDIIEEGCDLVSAPSEDNQMRACVKAWVIFETGVGHRRYEALADAYSGNCISDYGIYITSMADTRAKGRCFRNALKLKRVISAEEVDPAMASSNDGNHSDPVDTSQLTGIRIVANRIGASIPKILASMEMGENIGDLKKGDAKKVLQNLNEMSLAKKVPEHLREE